MCTMWNWFRNLKDKFVRLPLREMTMGEFIDKRSIMMVKALRNIQTDYLVPQIKEMDDWLYPYADRKLKGTKRDELKLLMDELFKCNNTQFDFEDQVLELGGEEGLQAAKNSREWNQHRAKLKRQIDKLFGEKYLEVKKYATTKHS